LFYALFLLSAVYEVFINTTKNNNQKLFKVRCNREQRNKKSDYYSQPHRDNLKEVGLQLGQSALDSGSGKVLGQQVFPKRREFDRGVGDEIVCQQHAHLVQVEQRSRRFGRVHHEPFLASGISSGKQIALISVTAVEQVPCAEEIDDIRTAHIAVTVAQLV